MDIQEFQLSFSEFIALLGFSQCVLVSLYILTNFRHITREGLPFIYFVVLGTAFFLDFLADFVGDSGSWYQFFQWLFWFSGPPLSVLVTIQIANITEAPSFRHYRVLLLIPVAVLVSFLAVMNNPECGSGVVSCREFHEWLVVSGVIMGGVSIFEILGRRRLLESIRMQKSGLERLWLVVMIIFINVAFLSIALSGIGDVLDPPDIVAMRSLFGIVFVYLVSTSLFRIYPCAISSNNNSATKGGALSDSEIDLALKIEKLLDMDKVYHESAYSRSDLARELGVSDSAVSRIINIYFQRNFSHLLNERRVEDAKRLLVQTDVTTKKISEEVGFNSIASFNRVFRDIAGVSPGKYRKIALEKNDF